MDVGFLILRSISMKNNASVIMKGKMNRRNFIKGSAIGGLIFTNVVASTASQEKKSFPKEADDSVQKFFFNKDGKFKILQLTDTHYVAGDPKSVRALDNVNQMLDLEKPDLVIHTGDVVYGKPAERSIREILEPISARKIPFAVTFGNHDEEFDRTRAQMLDIVRSIPYNINTKIEGIHGETNAVITLASSDTGKISRVFYLFDSNAYSKIEGIKGYDHIRFDQIAWYRQQSEAFTQMNGGEPIPSFAFFHIPLLEHKRAMQDDVYSETWGIKGELVASANVSSGLFVSMKEMKDIDAIFVGHDHDNDCATLWNRMFFIFGRFSGCDTVYNDLKPNGARVIELTEGMKSFRSWVRVYGGEVVQNLRYPEDFMNRFGKK